MELAPASLSAFLTVVNSPQNRLNRARAQSRAGLLDERAVVRQMKSYVSSVDIISKQAGLESLFSCNESDEDEGIQRSYHRISNDIYRISCHIAVDVLSSKTLNRAQKDNLLDGAIGVIARDFEFTFADKFDIHGNREVLLP